MKKILFVITIFGIFLASLLFITSSQVFSQPQSNEWIVASPDRKITVTVRQDQKLNYKIERENQEIIEYSPLGMTMEGGSGNFVTGLTFISKKNNIINETFSVKTGKKSIYTNHANELVLKFENSAALEMQLIIRAYDDGVAYRYHFPGNGTVNILSESSGFRLPSGTTTWTQRWSQNYENGYDQRSLNKLNTGKWSFPILAKLDNGNWALLTEAAVFGNYCGSHLSANDTNDRLLNLSFTPDQTEPITSDLPLFTPWRTAILGPNLGYLVESTLVENLNPSSEIADETWIQPGRVAWSWWSDPESPKDLNKQKEYVDFAAEMGWEYVLIDSGWKKDWIPEIISYAQQKGVEIILWFFWGSFTQWTPEGWKLSESAARSQFEKVENWGVKGVKIDFMGSENQERIQFYDMIGRLAAEYQITVNFHGSTKPAGEQRRWPHLLTREAVRGAEYKTPGAKHNATLPFTRNIIGPMDYTPVTFSNPGNTTYAHQLALSVVFESPLQHFADSSDYYRASLAKDFLKDVPVAWDETKFIDGYPGSFVILARKKGNDWYIGGINASPAREIQIPLLFLDNSVYEAILYKDGISDKDIAIKRKTVTPNNVLNISMKSNGGTTVYLYGGAQPTPTPSPSPACAGPSDINCDDEVDVKDFLLILNKWGQSGVEDINKDSKVNAFDLLAVLGDWGS